MERARRHLDGIDRFGPERPVSALTFFEFGAGWDLAGPLSYWCAGVDRQIVVDLAPCSRLELVNASLAAFATNHRAIEEAMGRPIRPVTGGAVTSIEELALRFGIRYVAPVDARHTPFDTGSFDVITSTDTLEHVPAEDLPAILVECRRLLAPDGVMSHLVDLMDHYRYVDDRITVSNFLRFSDRAWGWLNSPLEHQNRLRRPAYSAMVQRAGFVVRDEEVRPPSEADVERLRRMRLADGFREMDLYDVGCRSVKLVSTPR
ncbi:MAG: methyltransferase domain-containing protein [Nitriliruptorales bacterium]|nr:methyltransferase domain-containing protein [Nitriliruptorales bacterium]